MMSFDTILSLLKKFGEVQCIKYCFVFLIDCAFVILSTNSLLNQSPWRRSPVFYSLNLVVLTPFRSQIHLEVIFMSDVR